MNKKKWFLVFSIPLLVFIIIKFPAIRSALASYFPEKEAETKVVKASENTVTPSPVQPKKASVAPVFQDGVYTLSIPSSIGTLTYYNQTDVRWADAIYGGSDPVSTHGCGPTVLAMLVSSFTNEDITPDAMAAWAKDNNYWVSNSGSLHSLIPEGAAHYGLAAESFSDYTQDGILNALKDESILVALMGPGHFTDSGHFIILADDWSGASVRIADSNSLENSQKPWKVSLILDELNYNAQSGGPLWRISIK